MQEKNRHILEEAIQKLPQHEPEALVWLAIDAELEVIEKENSLQTAIQQLPSYNPSDSLWENIEKDLEGDVKKAGRVVWLKRAASIAAFIAFLLVGNLIFNQDANQESVTITYSQEVVEDDLLKQDWDDDDDAFEMVMAFCKTENIVCELPEFIVLKTEITICESKGSERREKGCWKEGI